jgi:NAD(P)-dependent dehydrogenase (short-subunit alcohol dehydrogenase family)
MLIYNETSRIKTMKNKIVLVTGSTDGIGKQTALELAKKNAYVLIHGKDRQRCHQTAAEIAAKSGNNKLQPSFSRYAGKFDVLDPLLKHKICLFKKNLCNRRNLWFPFFHRLQVRLAS